MLYLFLTAHEHNRHRRDQDQEQQDINDNDDDDSFDNEDIWRLPMQSWRKHIKDDDRHVMFRNHIKLGRLLTCANDEGVTDFLNEPYLGFIQHVTKTMSEQREGQGGGKPVFPSHHWAWRNIRLRPLLDSFRLQKDWVSADDNPWYSTVESVPDMHQHVWVIDRPNCFRQSPSKQ
jgi:hypothetical protein